MPKFCEDCKKVIINSRNTWCQKCYLSFHHPMKISSIAKKSALARTGNNSPLYGKPRTEEVKKKISETNRGRIFHYIDGRTQKDYFCKLCNRKISLNNGLYGSGLCIKCGGGWENHLPNCIDCGIRLKAYGAARCVKCEGKRRKLLKVLSGKNNPHYGKPAAHGKGDYYKETWMRSSWEIAYAKWLDRNNIKWLYEQKIFEITYEYGGELNEGTYRPDFYLPETNEYIEIKGYWRDDARVKFEAFKEKYKKVSIKVLMEEDLINMGVIK